MGHKGGEDAPTGIVAQPKAIPATNRKRKCKACGKRLNRYNRESLCWQCWAVDVGLAEMHRNIPMDRVLRSVNKTATLCKHDWKTDGMIAGVNGLYCRLCGETMTETSRREP